MARISLDDVRSWVESSKLDPAALDIDLLNQIEDETFAQLNSVYDTSLWIDRASTPSLVRTIISKLYAGWLYDKYYSENQNQPNRYAFLLKTNATNLISGILQGTIELPGVAAANTQQPTFYPTDASSAMDPTTDDPSLGPARFSLGKLF